MRRILLVALSTVAVLVLLFSYRTSTGGVIVGTGAATRPLAVAPSPQQMPTPASTPGRSTGSSRGAGSGRSAASGTYTGQVVGTQWGPVQVRITVKAGQVVSSTAAQHPSGNGRSDEINSVAVPILNQEAVQKQSASIDTVSGASLTSEGYRQSLQSALDQAHL